MLRTIYKVQLTGGRYRSLGYAIPFAKALSANLTIAVSPRPATGMMSAEKTNPYRHGELECSVEDAADLVMIGKKQPDRPSSPHTRWVERHINLYRSPTLLIPYDFTFESVRNILFTGNTPGLMDEPLLHHIAAAFLPRAYRLEGVDLQRIHWNNVSLIPEDHPHRHVGIPAMIAQRVKEFNIDLVVMPLAVNLGKPMSLWGRQLIAEIHAPILLFPSRAQPVRIRSLRVRNRAKSGLT